MNGKLLIVHGGGPTAVINASLAGAIAQGQQSFSSVLGARFGTGGLLSQEFVSLDGLAPQQLQVLAKTPGSAIGTGRDHLEPEDFDTMAKICKEHGITAVAMNGGNGTMDTCLRFSRSAQRLGINVCGIPKTMDNDLSGTDHSPGYGSAARYLAGSVREAWQDVQGLPIHVVVIESFGRDAGWITAASALARQGAGTGPQMIMLPEVAFDEEQFLSAVTAHHDSFGGVIVVASEGLRHADGTPIVEPVFQVGRSVYFGDVSAHLATLVTKKLGIKARSEKPGLLGRASSVWASEIDRHEARDCGAATVKALAEGATAMMSSIAACREGNSYNSTVSMVPIDDSVLQAKTMPKEFYDPASYDVTQPFLDYVKPLVGDHLGSFISFVGKEHNR